MKETNWLWRGKLKVLILFLAVGAIIALITFLIQNARVNPEQPRKIAATQKVIRATATFTFTATKEPTKIASTSTIRATNTATFTPMPTRVLDATPINTPFPIPVIPPYGP